LNTMSEGSRDAFNINITFNKAFDKRNVILCDPSNPTKPVDACANPNTWLQTTEGKGTLTEGVSIAKNIKNNEQEKFLLGVEVKNAPPGTYVFDMIVCTTERTPSLPADVTQCSYIDTPAPYDALHKLYVEVS